jgi:predicted dehydrogenase
MMDLGIYAVQAARYSVGEEPSFVTAQEFKTDHEKFSEVDETILWQMDFPGGAVSNSFTSYSSIANRLFISSGSKWMELRPAFNYRGIKGRTDEGEMNLPEINQQAAQMDDFSKCIIENTESDASGEEGLADLKVMESVYRSIKSGKKEKV